MSKLNSVNPFISIVLILLGFIVGYFYYSQTSGDYVSPPLPATISDPSFVKFKDMSFDMTIFGNQQFGSLKTLGDYPIQPGFTGKQNLFAP